MRLKTLLPLVMACVISGLPVAAQQPAAPASARIEYKYKAGDIDRYKMVVKLQMNISMPGMPGNAGMQANVSTVSVLKSKVLGILPNGNAKIRYAYESMTMDMDMPGIPAVDKNKMDQAQKELVKQMPVTTAVVTKYGQIVSMDVPNKIEGLKQGADIDKLFGGQMGFGLGTGSVVFPADLVSVGDAWTQDIPIMGAGKMTVDSMLESLHSQIGSKVATKIKQDYYGHIDLADLMKAMMAPVPGMNGAMDISGWGVAYVDPTLGKLVRSDSDVNMTARVTGTPPAMTTGAPSQPVNVDVLINMKINVVNLP